MTQPHTLACQCEHLAHTCTPEDGPNPERTPHGNPGHRYGARFASGRMIAIATERGAFNVCPDCARDCHADDHQAGADQ